MFSLAFDDFPKSAWTRGGPILAGLGLTATYYACGGLCGSHFEGREQFDEDDLLAVSGAGHEIGCHTFSHLAARGVDPARLQADLAANLAFFERVLGAAPASFAYPYGEVDAAAKSAMGARFASARGIRAGVNAGRIDLALLAAMPLERRSWSAPAMERLAAEAARRGGWLILFTHDIDEDPGPYGASPAMLEAAIGIARRHGLQSATVGAAAASLGDGASCAEAA